LLLTIEAFQFQNNLNSQPALSVAVENGHLDVVTLLIEVRKQSYRSRVSHSLSRCNK